MTDNPDEQLNPAKVRALIAHVWAQLDPQDQADRIAADNARGIHGVLMCPDDDGLIEFVRGARRLALVNPDLLRGDGPFDVEAMFMPEDLDVVTVAELIDGDDENN